MNTIVKELGSAGISTVVNSRSVGKKLLMAISGFVAFGYVVGHMLGNLQIFIGQDQLNAYAEVLHSMGPFLWVIRAFLLLFFVIHIWKGIQLTLENWRSRPVNYQRKENVEAGLASRTMIWTGLVVMAFVVYHLLHFTVRATNPEYQQLVDGLGRIDVYSMVILGFSNYYISAVYVIAVGLGAYHLSHAISSMLQTMGWANSRTLPKLEAMAVIISIILFVGYVSIPVAVMTRIITLPTGGM